MVRKDKTEALLIAPQEQLEVIGAWHVSISTENYEYSHYGITTIQFVFDSNISDEDSK